MTTTPIQLTTIGSRCVAVRASPAALAPGGVQIEMVSYAGTVLEDRLTVSLSADEAHELAAQLHGVLGSSALGSSA